MSHVYITCKIIFSIFSKKKCAIEKFLIEDFSFKEKEENERLKKVLTAVGQK